MTHNGYASAAAYCYVPSPRKHLAQLDPFPFLWASEGEHPPLDVATRAPVNSKAMAGLREKSRLTRAEAGKEEQRFSDIDVWPVVVRQNIVAGMAGRDQLMAYAKGSGGAGMVRFVFSNWAKIPELIERAWQAEHAEKAVAEHHKTRMQYIEEAAAGPCVCGGRWQTAASQPFSANSIDAGQWSAAVHASLSQGRRKGNVVCHAGYEGDEGKSFLLEPLGTVFGNDKVLIVRDKRL